MKLTQLVFRKGVIGVGAALALGLMQGPVSKSYADTQAASQYDVGVQNLKKELGQLDETLRLLKQVLHRVQLDGERIDARISYFNSKDELVEGQMLWKLKPEQPQTDQFVLAWAGKNDYVPEQMKQLVLFLRMPDSARADQLMKQAEAKRRQWVLDLVTRKKADKTYEEARDLPIIEALVTEVRKGSYRKTDASLYLQDKAYLDRLLKLRTEFWTQPVSLSKKVLEIVAKEGAEWSPERLRKTLFFVPVKKYFWQLVAEIEKREGKPMNWVISDGLRLRSPELFAKLEGWAAQEANRPVLLSQMIWKFVDDNREVLNDGELEVCLHFTPTPKYANRINNLMRQKKSVGFAGFTPVGTETALLSTQNVARLQTLRGDLVGMFKRNPKGSPQPDFYFDANADLGVLRQDNSQGGETWLTPYRPIHTPGDGGSFVFSYFDSKGQPLGFARRSELTSGIYFYDLNARLIGVAKSVLRETPRGNISQTVYAGRFYFLF